MDNKYDNQHDRDTDATRRSADPGARTTGATSLQAQRDDSFNWIPWLLGALALLALAVILFFALGGDADLDVDSGDVDVNVEEPDVDLDVEAPDVDVDVPDVDVEAPDVDVDPGSVDVEDGDVDVEEGDAEAEADQ